MMQNRYPGKCSSCKANLNAGEGFAYKLQNAWKQVCNSTACMKNLGVTTPSTERKITTDGYVIMPYDPNAITLLRSLPGAKWEPNSKRWAFSTKIENLPRVIEIAQQLNLDIPEELKKQAQEGTKESQAALARAEAICSNNHKLFPYQKDGVVFLALHNKALLADAPGVGKTVQSIVALEKNDAVLLIVPAAVKYNWQDEFIKWRPEFKITICEGRKSFTLPQPNEVVIINPDILPSWQNDNKEIEIPNDVVQQLGNISLIADECHAYKNFRANRSQKLKQIAKHCKRVWFLTGTPLMNRPQDLYGVLDSGDMQVLGSWTKFVSLFNGFKNSYGGYEFGMPGPEVPERLKTIMLRRLKEDVLKDLPAKVFKDIKIDIDKETGKVLDDVIIKAAVNKKLITEKAKKPDANYLMDMLDETDLPSFEEFSRIRAMLAESRIPAMIEIIESYEESETPLVVFSAHRKPIDSLSSRPGWGIITGDVSSEDRRNIVKDFQDGKLKGVGLTIAAGGVGITLTRASNELFVDLDWTPSLNAQAQDRLHRIGQKAESILIMQLVSNHPLDRHIHELIKFKTELAKKSLDEKFEYKQSENKIELKEETEEQLQQRINEENSKSRKDYFRFRIEQVADRELAKVSNIPLPALTMEKKQVLLEALQYLAGNCDGAQTKDGVGFSKPDAAIGHWLAETGMDPDDDKSFRILERILCRYKKQLSSFSIWD